VRLWEEEPAELAPPDVEPLTDELLTEGSSLRFVGSQPQIVLEIPLELGKVLFREQGISVMGDGRPIGAR
jgi:hypothetical protein